MIMLESDADVLHERLDIEDDRLWSPMALWETVAAVKRLRKVSVAKAYRDVEDLSRRLSFRLVEIGETEALEAVSAFGKYGRGSGSAANLNMGDCFAYACARTNRAKLLYKGNDFIHTDLR